MRLFLDASVLYAMATSPKGGARELLRLAGEGTATLITSEYALNETERALGIKSPAGAEIFAVIRHLSIWEIVNHSLSEARKAQKFVKDPDDAPIVAAAKLAHADALVSFDRKHLFAASVEEYLGISVITAGDALSLLRTEEEMRNKK